MHAGMSMHRNVNVHRISEGGVGLLKGHYLSSDYSDSHFSLRDERFILALIYGARGTVWMKAIKAIILA